MPLTRAEKEKQVAELHERLGTARSVYLTDLTGMSVELLTSFRRTCRENGIRLTVVKNTLVNRAARSTPFEALGPHLNGPTAVMTTEADAVSPARVLEKFIKENKGLPKIKVACLEGEVYDEAGVQALAKLPSREALLGQLLSVLNAPLTQLVVVLSATARNLANVLDQVAQQKQGSGAE
jgi:large subunit ribosomal protein L10